MDMYSPFAGIPLRQSNGKSSNLILGFAANNYNDQAYIDLVIFYNPEYPSDARFGYCRSPYSNHLRKWRSLGIDWDSLINQHWSEIANKDYVYDLCVEYEKELTKAMTASWQKSIENSVEILASGSFGTGDYCADNLSLYVLKTEIQKTQNYSDLYSSIMARIRQTFLFELDSSRYLYKRECIKLSFDYSPLGLLSGVSGIEFPVWKKTFFITETALENSDGSIVYNYAA